ncbi:hypothetical protein ADUPG1_013302, partial [Aduncisulcus paluster]
VPLFRAQACPLAKAVKSTVKNSVKREVKAKVQADFGEEKEEEKETRDKIFQIATQKMFKSIDKNTTVVFNTKAHKQTKHKQDESAFSSERKSIFGLGSYCANTLTMGSRVGHEAIHILLDMGKKKMKDRK